MNTLMSPHLSSSLSFKDTTMPTVVVCPNCRTSANRCANIPPPCQACQRCIEVSTPCVMSGLIPHFPLPYVCRHWLYMSNQSPPLPPPTCCHAPFVNCHALPTTTVQQLHQIKPVNHFQTAGGTVIQNIDLQTTNFTTSAANSPGRSGSPESIVDIPDVVVSVNGLAIATIQKPWSAEEDHRVLCRAKEMLVTSGWYYGKLSWQDAATLLANTKEGTFLLRDSSNPRCPFAISVQTRQGPTSIRIEYERAKFWLDCERKGVTPQLHCVMDLIQYYMQLAGLAAQNNVQETMAGKNIWVDHKGRVFSPIRIVKPLVKQAPSLKHLCRLVINSKKQHSTSLPTTLNDYLQAYPYTL